MGQAVAWQPGLLLRRLVAVVHACEALACSWNRRMVANIRVRQYACVLGVRERVRGCTLAVPSVPQLKHPATSPLTGCFAGHPGCHLLPEAGVRWVDCVVGLIECSHLPWGPPIILQVVPGVCAARRVFCQVVCVCLQACDWPGTRCRLCVCVCVCVAQNVCQVCAWGAGGLIRACASGACGRQ